MTKIVCLLGAGFSEEFGVPTMRRFFDSFLVFCRRRYPVLAPTLDKLIEGLGQDADIESLLARLHAVSGVSSGLPPGYAEDQLAQWMSEAAAIRSHLVSFIIERCERFDGESAVATCTPLLTALAQAKAAIFTTNYDRIIEHVCDEIGLALDDGFITSLNEPVAPWEGGFGGEALLGKIHGSVTWYNDLSESIRARSETACTLVVGRHAQQAADKLHGAQVVSFDVSTGQFLSISQERLQHLLITADEDDLETRISRVRDFVAEEQARLAEIAGLTAAQQEALNSLRFGAGTDALVAVNTLRDVAHPEVVNALIRAMRSPEAPLRSAAAGALGQMIEPAAIGLLTQLAVKDDVPVVRIEAAEALKRIGTEEAVAGAAAHALAHPEDQLPT